MSIPLEDDDTIHIPSTVPYATSGPGGAARGRVNGATRGGAKKKPPPCPVCHKGFQLKRIPATHIKCRSCDNHYHKRCVTLGFTGNSYLCADCNSESSVSVLVPVIQNLPGQDQSIHQEPHMPESQCCSELLLSEPQDVQRKPYFSEHYELANKRLSDLGFIRSVSQPQTPGDGDCAIHGILDQV